MSIRFIPLVALLLVLALVVGCETAGSTPTPLSSGVSAVPGHDVVTPVPPTATSVPPTLVPTALPGALTVAAPPGDSPTLDGTLAPGEWDGALGAKFSDDSELLLMQNGGYLYLGIRANLEPPEGSQGNRCATFWSVYLDRGDGIAVLHSSAALGTAVYKRTESGWQKTRPFAWTQRGMSNGETAQRQQFLEKEGWLASLCAMGKPEEAEFQLAMPQGSLRLAVAFPLPPYDKAALWPAELDDAVGNVDLLEGNAPTLVQFSPERWGVVTVATAPGAGSSVGSRWARSYTDGYQLAWRLWSLSDCCLAPRK